MTRGAAPSALRSKRRGGAAPPGSRSKRRRAARSRAPTAGERATEWVAAQRGAPRVISTERSERRNLGGAMRRQISPLRAFGAPVEMTGGAAPRALRSKRRVGRASGAPVETTTGGPVARTDRRGADGRMGSGAARRPPRHFDRAKRVEKSRRSAAAADFSAPRLRRSGRNDGRGRAFGAPVEMTRGAAPPALRSERRVGPCLRRSGRNGAGPRLRPSSRHDGRGAISDRVRTLPLRMMSQNRLFRMLPTTRTADAPSARPRGCRRRDSRARLRPARRGRDGRPPRRNPRVGRSGNAPSSAPRPWRRWRG